MALKSEILSWEKTFVVQFDPFFPWQFEGEFRSILIWKTKKREAGTVIELISYCV